MEPFRTSTVTSGPLLALELWKWRTLNAWTFDWGIDRGDWTLWFQLGHSVGI